MPGPGVHSPCREGPRTRRAAAARGRAGTENGLGPARAPAGGEARFGGAAGGPLLRLRRALARGRPAGEWFLPLWTGAIAPVDPRTTEPLIGRVKRAVPLHDTSGGGGGQQGARWGGHGPGDCSPVRVFLCGANRAGAPRRTAEAPSRRAPKPVQNREHFPERECGRRGGRMGAVRAARPAQHATTFLAPALQAEALKPSIEPAWAKIRLDQV